MTTTNRADQQAILAKVTANRLHGMTNVALSIQTGLTVDLARQADDQLTKAGRLDKLDVAGRILYCLPGVIVPKVQRDEHGGCVECGMIVSDRGHGHDARCQSLGVNYPGRPQSSPRPMAEQRSREALRAFLTEKYHGVVPITDELLDLHLAERGRPDSEPERAPEPDGLVNACIRCGYKFPRPQKRQTCQSQAACEKRQANRQQTAGLTGYRRLIADATGAVDPATLAEVEEVMRVEHPTLDGLDRGQFIAAAKRAHAAARLLKA